MNIQLPRIIFGSSALGNLYEIVPDATKLAITRTVSLEEAPAALAAWSENPGAITKIHVNL